MLALAPAIARADPPIEPLTHFPAAELTIAAHGQTFPFHVRLATTDARREQGLMFVKTLGSDEGMLFLWPGAHIQSFWMKNTLIPLDLLFIAADGVVIHIAADAVPLSEAPIGSMGPVKGVLEVRGGTARHLGIQTGDRVLFPAFSGL
jgi:uncharacterized membrane protein (UPF0127 family)